MTTDPKHEALSIQIIRLRARGDSMKKGGEPELADLAFAEAQHKVELVLSDSGIDVYELSRSEIVDPDSADRIAENLGVRGGLLRRRGRLDDALASYNAGATIERTYQLTSTYNRTNSIKLGLQLANRTVAEAQTDLLDLERALDSTIASDEAAAGVAWLWADLADCRLLLGNTRGAETAYREFATKAELQSPVTTLNVLRDLSSALTKNGDPMASDIARALRVVEDSLTST